MLESLITYISTFILFFTILSLVRIITNFIISILSSPPRKLVVGKKELIYYGICISYILTFLIYSL